MKLIRKILLSFITILSISGCSPSKFEGYENLLDEMNTYFNADAADFKIQEETQGITNPLLDIYCDEEKVIQRIQGHSDLLQINTAEYSMLDGDGYKVKAYADNQEAFDAIAQPTNFDIRKYITSVDKSQSNSFRLNFYVKRKNIKLFLPDFGIVDEIYEFLKEYKVTLDKVYLSAYFGDRKKLVTLSLVFDKEFYQLSPSIGRVRINYLIEGYGESVKKPPIDYQSYLLVNSTAYNMVVDDFLSYIENGVGFTFTKKSSPNTYVNDIPDDEVLGYLNLPNHNEYKKAIHFKDVDYDKDTGMCSFSFIGKTFSFKINHVEFTRIKSVGALDVDLDINKINPKMVYDRENNRLILEGNLQARVINVDSFTEVDTIPVEGTITNILDHGSVYHILTVTKKAESGKNKDSDCEGNIYVIDKETLDILNVYSVNTYPYYTQIDKRGNIIIAPGYGKYVSLYLFDVSLNKLECIEKDVLTKESSIIYDENLDTFVVNGLDTAQQNKLAFYVYTNGEYVQDRNFTTNLTEDIGKFILLDGRISIASNKYAVMLDDWHNLVYAKIFKQMPTETIYLAFSSGNYAFSFINYSDNEVGRGVMFSKCKVVNNNIKETVYFYEIKEFKNYRYNFGLVKDDLIYLYDYKSDSFTIFQIPL